MPTSPEARRARKEAGQCVSCGNPAEPRRVGSGCAAPGLSRRCADCKAAPARPAAAAEN